MEEKFLDQRFQGDKESEWRDARVPKTRMSFMPSDREREFPSPGMHAGKGPRSYRRPDESIYNDICERLAEDPYIDATEINVEVKDAEIILSGTVDNKNMKRMTEDIVERVRGVSHVENRIRVKKMFFPGNDLRSKVRETFR